MSSSAGASSVRRLIAAVRTAPSGPRPPKKAVLRHCAAVLLGHASWSAATLPMFPLQAGLGAFDPQLGPMLLGLLFAVATLTSCFAPIVAQKIGTNLVICIGHLITIVFVGVHLYPKYEDAFIIAQLGLIISILIISTIDRSLSHALLYIDDPRTYYIQSYSIQICLGNRGYRLCQL